MELKTETYSPGCHLPTNPRFPPPHTSRATPLQHLVRNMRTASPTLAWGPPSPRALPLSVGLTPPNPAITSEFQLVWLPCPTPRTGPGAA